MMGSDEGVRINYCRNLDNDIGMLGIILSIEHGAWFKVNTDKDTHLLLGIDHVGSKVRIFFCQHDFKPSCDIIDKRWIPRLSPGIDYDEIGRVRFDNLRKELGYIVHDQISRHKGIKNCTFFPFAMACRLRKRKTTSSWPADSEKVAYVNKKKHLCSMLELQNSHCLN